MNLKKLEKKEIRTKDDLVKYWSMLKQTEEAMKEIKKILEEKARELLSPGEKYQNIRINKSTVYYNPEDVEFILGKDFVYEATQKKVDNKKLKELKEGKIKGITMDQIEQLHQAKKERKGAIVFKK